MNNRRYNQHWINDEEVNRQIGELADTTRYEHYQQVIADQKQAYQSLSDSYNQGDLTKEQIDELALQNRINASFPSENNEQRWARQNASAVEAKEITEKM